MFVNKIFLLLNQIRKQSGHLLGQWQLETLYTSVSNSTPSYCSEKLFWSWASWCNTKSTRSLLTVLKTSKVITWGTWSLEGSTSNNLAMWGKTLTPRAVKGHIQTYPASHRYQDLNNHPSPKSQASLCGSKSDWIKSQCSRSSNYPVTCWHVNNFIMHVFLMCYAYGIKFHFEDGLAKHQLLAKKKRGVFPSAPGRSSLANVPTGQEFPLHGTGRTIPLALQSAFYSRRLSL